MKRIALLVVMALISGFIQPSTAQNDPGQIVGIQTSIADCSLPVGIPYSLSTKAAYADGRFESLDIGDYLAIDNPGTALVSDHKSALVGVQPGVVSLTLKVGSFTKSAKITIYEAKSIAIRSLDSYFTGDSFKPSAVATATDGKKYTCEDVVWSSDSPNNCNISGDNFNILAATGKLKLKCTAFGVWNLEKTVEIKRFQGEKVIFDSNLVDLGYFHGKEYGFVYVRNVGSTNVSLAAKVNCDWVLIRDVPKSIDAGQTVAIGFIIDNSRKLDRLFFTCEMTVTLSGKPHILKLQICTAQNFNECGQVGKVLFPLVTAGVIDTIQLPIVGPPGTKFTFECSNPRFRMVGSGVFTNEATQTVNIDVDATNPPENGVIEGLLTLKTEGDCQPLYYHLVCKLVKAVRNLKLTIGSSDCVLDGKTISLGKPVLAVKNNTYKLPFFALMSALGATFDKAETQRTLFVGYNNRKVVFFDKADKCQTDGSFSSKLHEKFNFDSTEVYVENEVLDFITGSKCTFGENGEIAYTWGLNDTSSNRVAR